MIDSLTYIIIYCFISISISVKVAKKSIYYTKEISNFKIVMINDKFLTIIKKFNEYMI